MTKHVLFIHDNRSLGGVGQVSLQLARGLQERGWNVDHLNLANRAGTWEHLSRVERARGVVLATQNFSTAYIACALGAISRRPWVMSVHGPVTRVVEAARPPALKRGLMRYVYRRAPVIACSSQASLASLQSFCRVDTTRQTLRVIHNTAAPSFSGTPASPPPSASTPAWRLGFVGRLSAEKRPERLIDALKLLPADYALEIVGTGPLAPQLVEQGRAEIASGRLRFAGQQEVSAATYRRWDATLLASDYEGYPLVLLESLASGVPVVSTPIPPAIEMLGEHAPSMLASDATPHAIAAAVQSLRAQDRDRTAREIAAVNAMHDPRAFIDAWDRLLTEALGA